MARHVFTYTVTFVGESHVGSGFYRGKILEALEEKFNAMPPEARKYITAIEPIKVSPYKAPKVKLIPR